MRIGFTYDLRNDYLAKGYTKEETAEFDCPETIDGITSALENMGFEVERIGNVQQLVRNLAIGNRWDFVFNICEGLRGGARESVVPALLEAYDIPFCFSSPLTLAVCLDKGLTKRILCDHNVSTAKFEVVKTMDDAKKVNLNFPVFVKPVAEGTGKGINSASCVKNSKQLIRTCAKLLKRFNQPVIVESYLEGREFTVGVVGNGEKAQVIGVMEIILGKKADAIGYSYENKEKYEDRVTYRLVDDPEAQLAAKTALDAWRLLDCRDGGRVDLRSDKYGIPHFLEVNPLAGLNPTRSDLVIMANMTGMTFNELIKRIVTASLERHGIYHSTEQVEPLKHICAS
ncbi:MAG: ATP-grasp domain-containing protein [Alphaproteobacteria bacterium]